MENKLAETINKYVTPLEGEILSLYFFEDIKSKKIAEKLRMSVDQVNKIKSDGLKHMGMAYLELVKPKKKQHADDNNTSNK